MCTAISLNLPQTPYVLCVLFSGKQILEPPYKVYQSTPNKMELNVFALGNTMYCPIVATNKQ